MKRAGAGLWILVVVIAIILTLWFLWWWQNNRPVTGGGCSASELTLSAGRTDGTAGTQYIRLVVTNNGDRTCALNGYPTVSLLDSAGNQLGNDAQQNNSVAATAVVLPPHGQAFVALGLPGATHYNSDVCSDMSTTLRMYLPGITAASAAPLTIPMAQKVCPGFSVSVFQYGS